MFDIGAQQWDEELLKLLRVPASVLPEVHDNAHIFGESDPAILGRAIPIAGMAGDQQAALFGQACFRPGMTKSTYGTGAFALMNIGKQADCVEEPHADHGGVPPERRDDLCAGRRDLHCGRGGEVAARRAQDHHPRV